MQPDDNFRGQLLAAVPSLRAFAISLTSNVDRADDLVQETLVRAMAKSDGFQPGTNLNAWLFTILRNLFHSEYRKRRREVEDPDGTYMSRLSIHAPQESALDAQDFLRAFERLNPDQKEALLLVVAGGFQFDEAAKIMGVAVGTAKSRVIRARARLQELLSLEPWETYGPSPTTQAALQAY